MKAKKPSPKQFDSSKYEEIIGKLHINMSELEFERISEVVVPYILISLKIMKDLEKLKKVPIFEVLLLTFWVSKNISHTLSNTRAL